MNVLVTGSKGFIGRNLCLELRNQMFYVQEFDKDNTATELAEFVASADFIVHLAGVNRPLTKEEFYDGNANLTFQLLEAIKKSGRKIPVIFSSTIQVDLNNDYGKSKKLAETYLRAYYLETCNPVYIYHLSNVFGKWCRPNYNSVIATFCYNISRNLDISVSNPENEISFVYIDDIVNEFIELINARKTVDPNHFHEILPIYRVKLGKLIELINSFKNSRLNLSVPDMSNDFEKKLYSTYLSYLETNNFSYSLSSHKDKRGSFTEFLKTANAGQISINVAKPDITKGNHWHHTKTEKFLVVSGEASIKFRKVDGVEVIEYKVQGDNETVIDIPPGYTHSITNIGPNDLVTVIWASEPFDPKKPDTYPMEVTKNE